MKYQDMHRAEVWFRENHREKYDKYLAQLNRGLITVTEFLSRMFVDWEMAGQPISDLEQQVMEWYGVMDGWENYERKRRLTPTLTEPCPSEGCDCHKLAAFLEVK